MYVAMSESSIVPCMKTDLGAASSKCWHVSGVSRNLRKPKGVPVQGHGSDEREVGAGEDTEVADAVLHNYFCTARHQGEVDYLVQVDGRADAVHLCSVIGTLLWMLSENLGLNRR